MAESRRRADQDFKEGAVRIVRETGKRSRRWPGTWASSALRPGVQNLRLGVASGPVPPRP